MKKKYLVTTLLIFTIACGYSQEFGIGFQIGLGTYSMSELRYLNSYIDKNLPIKTKLVSDFPAYMYLRPHILWNFEKYGIGFSSIFQSTGSRVSAKDYSGEYRFDIKVKSHNPGIFVESALFIQEKTKLTFSSIAGISLSKLKMEEYVVVYNEILSNDKTNFKALNYYFEPGLNFYYKIYFMTVGINAGYFLQLGKQAYYTNYNKNHKLINPQNYNPIKPDWNGFRLGLSIRCVL